MLLCLYPAGSHHTTAEAHVKTPQWFIFHIIPTYRQHWTDFSYSPAVLQLALLFLLLCLTPPHTDTHTSFYAWVYISVARLLSQASDTAFPKTSHQPPAQELNQARNRCKRTQRQPELRQLKAVLAFAFVWHAVIIRCLNWDLNHTKCDKLSRLYGYFQARVL